MTFTTSDDFAHQMIELARAAAPFRPSATYDPDGDCVEFLVTPDSFYGERIDDVVTVYRSHDTDEVVGSLIKGVTRLLKRFPNLQIVVDDGKVKIEHLFVVAGMVPQKTGDQPLRTISYRKLIAAAHETGVEADLNLACT
jgi:hypothetical protein